MMRMFGQTSWHISNRQVDAFVTELGGHLGPVAFQLPGKRVQPYSIAPWAEEKGGEDLVPLLKALRGDFFCLPFGGNGTAFRGEHHPPHGDTANARWALESLDEQLERTTLHLSLNTSTRPGRVDKKIFLIDGQHAVYCQHTVSGMRGPMSVGHHAMIRFPDEPGGGVISTSRIAFGQVLPEPFERPENRGYCCLQPGATFESLEAVPTVTGGTADLTRYPARRGFEDLVMLVNDPEAPFAWNAIVFPAQRYVWFALKNPRILRNTVFWISNGGRHYPPWNGRHVNVLGVEDVTAYFHLGLAESARKNPLAAKGFPTHLRLDPARPLRVPYIMGVAPVPAGFNQVASIHMEEKALVLEAANGKRASAIVAPEFLSTTVSW